MSLNLFGSGGGATAVAHSPVTASTLGLLAGFTGDNTATDVGAGSFVLDLDVPAYVTDGHYTGAPVDVFDISTTQLLGTTEGAASDAAFQIPVATAVTFGGMFFITGGESTPYYISCSTQATNINYAMVQVSGTINYQTSGGLYDTTVRTPIDCWFHLMTVSDVSRTDTQVYLNGVEIYDNAATVAGTDSTSAELYIGTVDAANGDFTGQVSDIIVADSAYTPAQVHAAAEAAFGHLLP